VIVGVKIGRETFGLDLEDLLGLPEVLEPVGSEISEPRACRQRVPNERRSRRQNALAAMGDRYNTSGAVHIDADRTVWCV
jgi:hypothetical protein